MNQEKEIHVYLLDEGTEVWRPVQAQDLGGQRFRIVSKNPHPEDEQWQFTTGDVVRCESRLLADSEPHVSLVAVEKIQETAEPAAGAAGKPSAQP